jgi:hypothetical protein
LDKLNDPAKCRVFTGFLNNQSDMPVYQACNDSDADQFIDVDSFDQDTFQGIYYDGQTV